MARANVYVDPPALADDLVRALVAADCVVERLDAATYAVEHPAAEDEREARIELAFFLRVWQRRHGGAVTLLESQR